MTKVKVPPPLNISEALEDEELNHKTARILKNDLLLHEAVIKNEADAVRKVLKETVDVDSRNNYGRAPIHWAASRGSTEIIEMLIQAKCDIEARDKMGSLDLSMSKRDVACSKFNVTGEEVLSHINTVIANAKDWGGHIGRPYLAPGGPCVSSAIRPRPGTPIRARSGPRQNFYTGLIKEYTLLMCGARGGSAGVVNYLAEALESLNGDATDCTGATAIHHAALAGHPSVITALSNIPGIELEAKDKKGQTPMHCACSQGHLEAVEVLIGLGAYVDAQDKEGNTPLHVTTRNRYTAIAQLLLKVGANTELTDEMGVTSLHVAASQGCKGILQSIIQHGGFLNKQCKNGNTPLHLACQSNEVDTVEILVNKGADLNSLNTRLQSPIHIAAEMGHTEICKLLLAAGANIEQREQSGKTPLYIAARGSFTAIVDMIIKTARLDYPTPEDTSLNKELTPARRQWREETKGSMSNNNSGLSDHVRSICWRVAYKQLGSGDWKRLALHWAFNHDQINAIEHQYTGPSSYKEHGYRMLLIWASGLNPEVHPLKELHEALSAIGKTSAAEFIRKHQEKGIEEKPKSNKQRCQSCTIT
ncbi:ankyrin repeat and death domain-containing protein 1A-like [Belonocnema kinseyi]|uniref:ankyrin repeat and death domain-containing protein 1A-like n=1 Tax=Belonocnema kinseyi TaxID=2817044 RepID=UPI00143E0B30|nr:ankyrin repeat and death domain-containing protein 1A-like [Belonocnema kinseyi]